MKDVTILLFTNSYPYSGAAEQTFIENELIHLQKRYQRIILVPISRTGKRNQYLPSLELDESFSEFLKEEEQPGVKRCLNLIKAIFSFLFFKECLIRSIFMVRPRMISLICWWFLRAQSTEKWLKTWFLSNQNRDTVQIVVYTYWCSPVTLGAGSFCRNRCTCHAISRVLGSDLYESQHEFDYIPFRASTLDSIEQLFVVSELGKKYLEERYPGFSHKYTTSRIGVTDPGFKTAPSDDGTIRVVSCSYLVPVKRIELMIEGLKSLARNRKDWKILWTHIGDGPLKIELEKKISEGLPSNLQCHMAGYIPSILDYYHDNPVDVFINTSSSEGIPVSVMEAESCGIPVVATAVGGNPEIVSDKCGVLIPANPTPDEISDAIICILSDNLAHQSMRENARKNWEENFNSDKNFSAFVKNIDRILNNCGKNST